MSLPVNGVLAMDLEHFGDWPDHHKVRHALAALDYVPVGINVILRIGTARIWPDDILLHGLGLDRFRITIEGTDAMVIGAWVRHLRDAAA